MNKPDAKPGGMSRVTVIVPVRNGGMHLSRCLEALNRSEYRNFEVIVVNDCSTDDTPLIAQRYGARCLPTPRILGPAGARNLGALEATGEILAFVDADVVLPPEGLRLIVGDLAADSELAAVFGSYDDAPAWHTFVSQYKNLMHHYVHQTASESAATFWAGCGAVRKNAFDEFGGFDHAKYTAPSIEDIALGLEMVSAGRKIRLDKRLQAKHLKRWTWRSLLRADILFRAVPWTRLILSSRHLPRDLNLTYASRFSSLLVGLLALACALLPFSLAGLIWIPPMVLPGFIGVAAGALIILNWDVYRFFWRKRGAWFAARAAVAHWFYYLYSGATFFVCAAHHLVSPSGPATRRVRSEG